MAATAMRARKIGPDEVETAHAIIGECGRALAERYNLHQWNPPYAIDKMRQEAIARDVFVVEDTAPLATFTVGLTPLAAYTTRDFALERPALYLNRLAVRPPLWGQGVGAFAMQAVEARARALAVEYVRFDTVSAAEFLRRFYRRLGYEERGQFLILGIEVTCFEKRVP